MTAEEIRKAVIGPNKLSGIVFFLRELAAQTAEANELARTQMLTQKPKGMKQAAGNAVRSAARGSSSIKKFYVDRWKTAVDASMMPEFVPKEGFKSLDDLEVGESSEGKLGTDNEAKVTRKQ
jgi:hypothetical protein